MERVDKFGHTIYDRTWFQMCKNAKALKNAGYIEAKRKPNLFYKKSTYKGSKRMDREPDKSQTLIIDAPILKSYEDIRTTAKVTFFADMRGTNEVKIWHDTDPLIYWRFSEPTPDWKMRRVINAELKRLSKLGCPWRLSYYATEFESLMFSNEDGFCRYCGKDFQSDGRYCSDGCMKNARERYERRRRSELPACHVCHKKLEWEERIDHHASYYPEEIVIVCRSCHQKIHRAHRWILKPAEGESEKFYRKAEADENVGMTMKGKVVGLAELEADGD